MFYTTKISRTKSRLTHQLLQKLSSNIPTFAQRFIKKRFNRGLSTMQPGSTRQSIQGIF